ncbi:MAG: hypothetical protein ACR2L2_15345 [Acidobacteriota bacterium]
MRPVWLFLLTSLTAGFVAVAGSILGNAFGKTGLFAGAIAGEVCGVVLAAWLAVRLRLIHQRGFAFAALGGVLGFGLAAVIATNNLHTPVIPVLSVSLVGLGTIFGSIVGQSRDRKGAGDQGQ